MGKFKFFAATSLSTALLTSVAGPAFAQETAAVGDNTDIIVVAQDHLNLNADWNSVMGLPVDLSFFMTNGTNEGLILFPVGGFFTWGVDGGHVNEPRMWGVRLKYRFGE